MVPSEELFPGGAPDRPWAAPDGAASIELDYSGGGAFAAADGEGRIAVRVDGEATEPVEIQGPGAWKLTSHPRHETHRLELTPDRTVRLYSVQFPPVPPG